MREQRKAAMSEGRPASRGMDEVECQLFVKDQSAPKQSAPQVIVFHAGDEPEPAAQGTPEVLVLGDDPACE